MDPVMETQGSGKTSWFLDALGEVAVFAGRLARQFFKFFLIGVGFTIPLAALVGYSSSEGLLWKGTVGGVMTLVGGVFVAFGVAAKLSTVMAAGETVRAKGIGRKILDALFARLLGVTDENPQGDHELTKSLHGLPVADVESRLHQAGRALLENRVTAVAVPRVGLWLANQVQKILVWATIRVVVKHCTSGKSRRDTIDLLALRASLASEVDKWVIERLQQGAFRFMLLAGLAVVFASWLIVKALHLLPGA